MTAWKALELRIARALGGERSGPQGKHGSDATGTPFSLECKRTTRYQLRRAWIEQARRQAKQEERPWLLVVSEHNDRRPIVVLDFWVFAQIAQQAGLIPSPLVVEPPETLESESDLLARLVQAERERDELGPLFIRDCCRILGVDEKDTLRMDKIAARLAKADKLAEALREIIALPVPRSVEAIEIADAALADWSEDGLIPSPLVVEPQSRKAAE